MMIEEVPVGSGKIPDIRSHGDDLTTRAKTAVGFPQGAFHSVLISKMFKKIAGEHDIERPIRQIP